MTEIEILMMDNCTKAEAERHLNNGTLILGDFEENFESYMSEWDINEDEEPRLYAAIKKMVEEKIPAPDWGIVEIDEKIYYIMYCL